MIVNIVKLLIVVLLITFLVIRYRTRTDAAVSPEFRVAESTPAPTQIKAEKTKSARLRRRDRTDDTGESSMGRQTRLRPRMMAKMPDPVDADSVPDTYDEAPHGSEITGAIEMPSLDVSPVAEAEPPPDIPGDVVDPVAQAIDLRLPNVADGTDSPISTPGWPAPNEFVSGGVSDPFTAEAAGPAESLEPAATDDPTGADQTAEVPQLRAAAGWANVDVNEVGLDDALVDDASQVDPPSPPDWQNDDDFDPASGWANPEGAATWTPAEPETSGADELVEAAAWGPETPESWHTAPDSGWQPDQTEAAESPAEAPTPTWDVSDWTAPTAEGEAPGSDATEPAAPQPDASAITDGLPVTDQSAVEPQDAAPPDPPAETVAPVTIFEVVDPADTAPAFESSPAAAVEWGMPVTEADEAWPADSDDGATRSIIPVSAVPNAPVIMYLEAGDEEMKVVIERDQLGNPIAWVLSGAAKVDAEGSAIRVRIPSGDDPEEAAIRDEVARAADLPVAELKDRLARAEIALAEIAARMGGTSELAAPDVAEADAPDLPASDEHSEVEVPAGVLDESGDGTEDTVVAPPVSQEPTDPAGELTGTDEQPDGQSEDAVDEPEPQPFAGVELDLDSATLAATDDASGEADSPDEDAASVADTVDMVEDVEVIASVESEDEVVVESLVEVIDDVEPEENPEPVVGAQEPLPTVVPKPGELSRKEARRRAMEGASAHAALDDAPVEKANEPKPKAKPKKPRSTTKRTRAASGVVARAAVADAPLVAPSAATGSTGTSKRSRRQPEEAPREVDVVAESLSAGDGYGHAMDIAVLVQEEANRRFAQVLAQHGSVKTNGDFWGLVDRLEHVADAPAVDDEA